MWKVSSVGIPEPPTFDGVDAVMSCLSCSTCQEYLLSSSSLLPLPRPTFLTRASRIRRGPHWARWTASLTHDRPGALGLALIGASRLGLALASGERPTASPLPPLPRLGAARPALRPAAMISRLATLRAHTMRLQARSTAWRAGTFAGLLPGGMALRPLYTLPRRLGHTGAGGRARVQLLTPAVARGCIARATAEALPPTADPLLPAAAAETSLASPSPSERPLASAPSMPPPPPPATFDFTFCAAVCSELRRDWVPSKVEGVVQTDAHTLSVSPKPPCLPLYLPPLRMPSLIPGQLYDPL